MAIERGRDGEKSAEARRTALPDQLAVPPDASGGLSGLRREGLRAIQQRFFTVAKRGSIEKLTALKHQFPGVNVAPAIRQAVRYHLTDGFVENAPPVAELFPEVDLASVVTASKGKVISNVGYFTELGLLKEAQKLCRPFARYLDFTEPLTRAFEVKLEKQKFSRAKRIFQELGAYADLRPAVQRAYQRELSREDPTPAATLAKLFERHVDFSEQRRAAFVSHLAEGSLERAKTIAEAYGTSFNLAAAVKEGFSRRLARQDITTALGIVETWRGTIDLAPEIRAKQRIISRAFARALAVMEVPSARRYDEHVSLEIDSRRSKAEAIWSAFHPHIDLNPGLEAGVLARLKKYELGAARDLVRIFNPELDLAGAVRESIAHALKKGSVKTAILIRNSLMPELFIADQLKDYEHAVKEYFVGCLTPKKVGDRRFPSIRMDTDEAQRVWDAADGQIDLKPEAEDAFRALLRTQPMEGWRFSEGIFARTVDAAPLIAEYIDECLTVGKPDAAMRIMTDWAKGTDITAVSQKHADTVQRHFVHTLASSGIDAAAAVKATLGQGIALNLSDEDLQKKLARAFYAAFRDDIGKAAKIRDVLRPDYDVSPHVDGAFLGHLEHVDRLPLRTAVQRFRDHGFRVIDATLREHLENRTIQRSFLSYEFAHAWKHSKKKLAAEPDDLCLSIREKRVDKDLESHPEDKQWYGELCATFGKETVLRFLSGQEVTYLHLAGPHIKRLFEASGLKPETFAAQILLQITDDTATYDNGLNSHRYFNVVAQGIDADVPKVLAEARELRNPKLLALVEGFEREGVFTTWKKHLQKYYQLNLLLRRKEVLARLEGLLDQGKTRQYEFFSTLAFHPTISLQEVIKFLEHPDRFLAVDDAHSQPAHDRKKPSNLTRFEHLDLSAADLRDALTEGVLDGLQFFPAFDCKYRIIHEDLSPVSLKRALLEAVGERSKGRPGRARNIKETFKAVRALLEARDTSVQRLLTDDTVWDETMCRSLEEILYHPVNGLKDDRKADEYRVTVHAKSSPEGHVAGNDTACCMPFGSGKNNVYMYNLGCAVLTVQRRVGDGFRTIAQSVLTIDADIHQLVAELVRIATVSDSPLHDLLTEDLSKPLELFVAADNIEITPNIKGELLQLKRIDALYRDFLRRYLQLIKAPRLRDDLVVVGKGYTDLPGLPAAPNTFVQLSPPAYSDNFGPECYLMALTGDIPPLGHAIVEEGVPQQVAPSSAAPLPNGIRLATAIDTLQISYLEGKLYADNESLIQYIHRIGNELTGKEINNTFKGRPNLSLVAAGPDGGIAGYLIAYEGVLEKGAEQEVPVIYVSDLAATHRVVGGRLMSAFITLVDHHYLAQGRALPILAEAREHTSFPLAEGLAKRLGRSRGISYAVHERQRYNEGKDTMRVVLVEPDGELVHSFGSVSH